MSVRQAIAELTEVVRCPPAAWSPPQLSQLNDRLLAQGARMRPPLVGMNAEAVERRWRRVVEEQAWEGIEPEEWHGLIHVLWRGERPLVGIHRVQLQLRHYLEASRTARPFKRLIYAYCEAFDAGLDGLEWAGALLRRVLTQRRFLLLEHWRRMDSRWELFTPTLAPRRLAEGALTSSKGWQEPFVEIGLDDWLLGRGLCRAAFRDATELMRGLPLEHPDAAVAVRNWKAWSQGEGDGGLRYPEFHDLVLELRQELEREAAGLLT